MTEYIHSLFCLRNLNKTEYMSLEIHFFFLFYEQRCAFCYLVLRNILIRCRLNDDNMQVTLTLLDRT